MEGKLIESPHYPRFFTHTGLSVRPLTPFLWTDGDVFDPRVPLEHLFRDFHGVEQPLGPAKVKRGSEARTIPPERFIRALCRKNLVGLAGKADIKRLAMGAKKELAHNYLLCWDFVQLIIHFRKIYF